MTHHLKHVSSLIFLLSPLSLVTVTLRASKALREASEVIADSPAALQLRYLQTLGSIAAEKNSTIVFPVSGGWVRSPLCVSSHSMKSFSLSHPYFFSLFSPIPRSSIFLAPLLFTHSLTLLVLLIQLAGSFGVLSIHSYDFAVT